LATAARTRHRIHAWPAGRRGDPGGSLLPGVCPDAPQRRLRPARAQGLGRAPQARRLAGASAALRADPLRGRSQPSAAGGVLPRAALWVGARVARRDRRRGAPARALQPPLHPLVPKLALIRNRRGTLRATTGGRPYIEVHRQGFWSAL